MKNNDKEEKTNKKEFFINLLKTTERKGVDKLINYLEKTDFFEAPASTKYHNSFKSGLVEHSLNVYCSLYNYLHNNEISLDPINKFILKTKDYQKSIIIVSLLHDICKINYYKKEIKWKKDNNKWESYEAYTIDDELPLGHGEKSIIILSNFIKLTEDEMMAIRWHMGFSENESNYSSINKCFENYPLSLALHIADLEATYYIENQKDINRKIKSDALCSK